MNFNRFTIHLEADGFRIENPDGTVPSGTPLVAYYELGSGWESTEVIFEPKGWSLLHPFTHAGMFIYTGVQPRRVVIKLSARAASFQPQRVVQDDWWMGVLGLYPFYSVEDWSDDSLNIYLNMNIDSPLDVAPAFPPEPIPVPVDPHDSQEDQPISPPDDNSTAQEPSDATDPNAY